MPLVLYVFAIALLALTTAYTRNFQRTLVGLQERLGDEAAARLTPRGQWARTALIAAGWPVLLSLGLLVVAWWKAVALAVGGFLLLVPVLGSFTPRAMAPHYLQAIRRDLAARIGRGGRDVDTLRRLDARLDALMTAAPPP
jgi:hypothetical protein